MIEMKKIVIVYGTRPELIKLIPLIKLMKANNQINLLLINTGQHKEMVEELEQVFDITPNINLNIMQHNQSLNQIMINVAQAINPILIKEKPAIVLVQGDTSTASTVATTCFYNKIPVGHIEAGLRSFNIYEPYPEEFNRKVISLLATFNFTPTTNATNNLLAEGVNKATIFEVGNTIVDMVALVKEKYIQNITYNENLILITAHRRENHGEGILAICKAIKKLVTTHPHLKFIWPLHPNPNVKDVVTNELKDIANVQLTVPLSYLSLTQIMQSCKLIWSDSGGIQEECPSFKKPVLILRNVTERPEVVTSGFGKIVGTNIDEIVKQTILILSNDEVYQSMIEGKNPFGNGTASQQIINIILEKL